MNSWKRLILISASFGAGFAIFISAIFGSVGWLRSRPQPWNSNALKASFETVELTTQPQQDSFLVDFLYNIENKTDRNYEIDPANLTVLANLTDGNALSKDFGHYQTSDAKIDGPSFIPAQGRARISIRVSYQYPSEFTDKDKNDVKKVSGSSAHRLKELSGFVIFDKASHCRIDLPEGWKNWDDVTKAAHIKSQ